MDPSSVKRRLTCILAADAVGYSKQMGQDEEGTIRVLSAHRAVIDGIIVFHQGRIVSTAGDSVLAEFSSAVEAVRCAVEIQEALKTRNDSLEEHRQMHFRVGVNLGDVVVKNEDLLGDGVNVAARLESMAEPGGICISSSVYDQITGKLDLGFQDIGEQSLKNISRPIHVYRVSGAAPPVRPARPAPPAPRARNPVPWAIAVVVAVVIGAAVAWQGGWLRSGSTDGASRTTAASPAVLPAPAPAAEKSAPPGGDAAATRAQAESDAQRLRSDAEAIKRQAEAELARARADAEAGKAARTKAEADAAAARMRAQAEADATRIRADAETAAARTRSDAEAAARATEAQASKAALAQRDSAAKAQTAAPVVPAAVASDKPSRPSAGSAGIFDGTWTTTVDCPKHTDGALGFTFDVMTQVKDGSLRGQVGTEGTAGWYQLQGNIQPDGNAKLTAQGLTGDAKFNIKSAQTGVPYAKGLPYSYQAVALFEGSRGTGRRLAGRICNLTFVKQ